MKVIVSGSGPVCRSLVPHLLADGHDVRVLDPSTRSSLPTGARALCALPPLDERTTLVHAVGGFSGDDPVAEVRHVLDCTTGDGRVLIVASVDVASVEQVLVDDGRPWTLQGATSLHEDVDGLLAGLVRGPALVVPNGVSLQPVAAAEVAERTGVVLRAGADGRVPDYGGPAIRSLEDLAAAWLAGRTGRTLLLPGPDDLKVTGWLAPHRAVGRTTWEEFVAASAATEDPRSA